jgi:site-specific DNA-cytosine methylase
MACEFNAVGAYIYAGGFTIGMQEHFNILNHFEDGNFGVATVRKNFPKLPIVTRLSEWKHRAQALNETYDTHVIYSNPPCAPWSAAGRSVDGKRGLMHNDPRIQCVENSFNLMHVLKPNFWIWESVARTGTAAREYAETLLERAQHIDPNYQGTIVWIQATDLGLAQLRKRTFVIIHNKQLVLKLEKRPATTFRHASDLVAYGRETYPDLIDERHANMSKAEAALIDEVEPGGSFRNTYNRLNGIVGVVNAPGVRHSGRPSFTRRRLHWDTPAFTMVGGAALFHPEERRMINLAEAKAICGFPQRYQLVGSTSNGYAELGKGVMPPTAAWLGGNLYDSLLADQPCTHAGMTFVDLTK